MDITFDKKLDNGVFSVLLSLDFTASENQLIEKFSEPKVDVGGSFTGPPAFTEPNNLRPVVNGFPQSFSKDSRLDAAAEDKVNVWISEMTQRLTDMILDLRSKSDGFTGSNTVTI